MRSLLRPQAILAAGICCAMAMGTSVAEDAKPPSDRELRSAMNRAEKRFFDLYNQVNDDARHEMNCGNEDRTGSRLRKSRTCRTQGEADISADAAKEYLRGLDLAAEVDTGAVRGQPQMGMNRDAGGPVAQRSAAESAGSGYADQASDDAGSRIQAQRAAFDKHLDGLIAKHPELKQRLDEYLLAKARYEAVRQK
jgi:hypothetical protein